MQRSRLRRYFLLSLLAHALCLWFLRFFPAAKPVARPPVAIRLLEAPPQVRSKPTPTPTPQRPVLPPQAQTPLAPVPPPPVAPAPVPPPPVLPPPPKQGGIVAEIPKPPRQERPDRARILSPYDSKAQDGGGGDPGARKPSGENPPQLPVPLPERYSRKGAPHELPGTPAPPGAPPSPTPSPIEPKPPEKATPPPPPKAAAAPRKPLESPPVPTPKPPMVAKKPTPAPLTGKEKQLAEARQGPAPAPEQDMASDARTPPPQEAPRIPQKPTQQESKQATRTAPDKTPTSAEAASAERHFNMTTQQEVAMLQRQQPGAAQTSKNNLNEHFARLEQRLPLLSFDAPGTYAKGVERPGEGQGQSGGGKYRSIDAYGIKHFSYLMRLKYKIELVLSIPPFTSDRGKIGVPIVGFTVRRNGELAEAVLLRSSGYPEFDQAVVRAIRRAAPYYPFPEHLPDQEISIQVLVSLS